MRPPSAWIERLTTSMPTPRPEMLETVAAVEKPGRKMRLSISSSVSCASAAISPFLTAIAFTRGAVDAGAVVGDFDHDAAGAMRGRQPHFALRRLAGGDARLRALEPVVDGVADHVRQRIGEALDHGAGRPRCSRPR